MLTQLHSELERQPLGMWAAAISLAILGFILFLRLRDRRRAARPIALTNEGGKKGIRFIRTSHRREADPEKRKKRRRTRIGFAGMGLVVVAGFALSASTSFVFAEKRLHFVDPWIMTAGLVLEAIVLGLTVYSWAFEDKGTARAAYLLVLAQAIGAIEVVRFQHEDLGTAGVRIVGPIMLAYGLHKMLGLETKLKKIEIRSNGMLARAWRHFLKWLESWLGISEREADAQVIRRTRAQDRLVKLSTLGKPRFMRQQKYDRLLMEMGDKAFAGLTNPLDELEVETRITTRKDRAEAFKRLPQRAEMYDLHSLRPARGPQGAPQGPAGFGEPLTSEGAAGRTPGHAPGAPGANPAEAQAQGSRAESEAERLAKAYDVYLDRKNAVGGDVPSQNAFETEWYGNGYGLTKDDVRALYKAVREKVDHIPAEKPKESPSE